MRERPIILIADQSETFVLYLSLLLRKLGFDVIPASDGTEAVSLAKLFNPDAIMLDVQLPKMDGIKTLASLKKEPGLTNVPAGMVTVDGSVKTRKKCEKAGGSFYLTKPINVFELHKVLQECVVYSDGYRRANLRTSCRMPVTLICGGKLRKFTAVTISEGGLYVIEKTPLPVGTKVQVSFKVGKDTVALDGTVIYIKPIYQGAVMRAHPGMAIAFDKVPARLAKLLRWYILDLLFEGIDEQDEIVFIRK